MKNVRFLGFAGLLVGGITVAVSSVVAQAPAPRTDARPRVMMLDGRGGQLGIEVRDLDAEGLKEAAGAPSGVRIGDVDIDGPAAKAGIKEGDIVVELDGDRVRSARQFARLIQETPEGRSVKLGIIRNGQRQTIDVTPESRGFNWGFDGDRLGREIARGMREFEPRLRELEPRLRELEPRLRELEPRLRELEPRFRELEPRLRDFRFDGPFSNFDFDMLPRMTSPRSRLGVQVETLTPQLGEFFGATDGGVLVASITKDSPAEKAGLKAGDVITSVNGERVRDYDDLIDRLRNSEGQEMAIGIVRDKKASTLKVTVEPAAPRRRPGQPA
jgi:S1-C subfamily serine protease